MSEKNREDEFPFRTESKAPGAWVFTRGASGCRSRASSACAFGRFVCDFATNLSLSSASLSAGQDKLCGECTTAVPSRAPNLFLGGNREFASFLLLSPNPFVGGKRECATLHFLSIYGGVESLFSGRTTVADQWGAVAVSFDFPV